MMMIWVILDSHGNDVLREAHGQTRKSKKKTLKNKKNSLEKKDNTLIMNGRHTKRIVVLL